MAFSRTIVDERDSLVNIFLGNAFECRSFGEELPKQTIGIFIRSPFPRMVWIGEVDFYVGIPLDELMFGKFDPIVICYGMAFGSGHGLESLHGDFPDTLSLHARNLVGKQHATLPFNVRENAFGFLLSDNSVTFPITDAFALFDDLWPRINSALRIFHFPHSLATIRAMPSSVLSFL